VFKVVRENKCARLLQLSAKSVEFDHQRQWCCRVGHVCVCVDKHKQSFAHQLGQDAWQARLGAFKRRVLDTEYCCESARDLVTTPQNFASIIQTQGEGN
jgi:hypothetical protein